MARCLDRCTRNSSATRAANGNYRGQRPFEEKESFRWLAATREAAKLAKAGAERITVVADRECDIYDELALRPAETDLVIRVHHNRLLADGRWSVRPPPPPARTGPRNDFAARRPWQAGP